MKLFLASEAKHPTSMKALEEFVGGFTGKEIAYIPTASNSENSYGLWKNESDSWKLVNTLGAKITPVVLEEFRDKTVIDMLRNKDIIWVAGGLCGYLMYWMRRCSLHLEIKNLLTNSLYVGSSAGSIACSKTIEIGEIFDNEVGASAIPGLDLVDFDIWPHYEDGQFDKIKNLYKGNKLYILKNGEAITVVDNEVKVLGEKRLIANI